MDELILRLRDGVTDRVDVTGVTPDALASNEPARLPVRVNRRATHLGDLFNIMGQSGARVRFVGALALVDGIGAGCNGGTVIVEGSAGRYTAAGMTAGHVEVHGDVADDAGAAMAGGLLTVHGAAGHRLGGAFPGERRGMTGGEIVVGGSCGDEAASLMRRGLVAVGGDTGLAAGRGMIAGTLVVLGALGPSPGIGNKRGTIVALGGVTPPATYRLACTYGPAHVRLLLRRLLSLGLPVADEMIAGRYHRYCGDAGGPGKGELLQWIQP